MAKQVVFTKQEAALLLDAYLKVMSGELSRKDAVKECSRMLRLMAVNSGIEIDDIYRNVNGIWFQMASMESAYQGRTITKPATRLFTEMVNLYMTDKKEYQKLLKEAKSMAIGETDMKAVFMTWLSQNVSDAQLSELNMAFQEIEQHVKKEKTVRTSLYENLDPATVKKIKVSIESSKLFSFTHKHQWEFITSALNYLLQFADQKVSETESQETTPRFSEARSEKNLELPMDLTPYKTILAKYFPKGYRLESALDMKRLRRYYKEETGTDLDLDQVIIEAAIRDCGIVYDGKLYMPQNMLSKEMKDQILSFIDGCFEEGRPAVYYEAIFREFSEDLLDHNIYNAEMLKAYLAYYVSDRYYIGRSYLSTEVRVEIDPLDEVRQCLKQYGAPVQVEKLCDSLSHITEDRIRSILSSNGEFVRNSKGEYFHADSLDLTEEELENIAAIIASAIEEHEFISGNELYAAIRIKYPYTFERNAAFSVIGWRDALKYKLANRFSFVGNIISRDGTSLSMSNVFAEYGKGRQRFSLEELEQFAESIGTGIYFNALYTNVIRISHQWFVSKNNASFSVLETDRVLERFCDGSYMPISSVSEFAVFPDASFPWTEYLLEQYVAFFSEKFYLLHGNYNKNCAVGAIVRKTCHFDSFDELVIDILAHSDIPLRKKEVLDYLAENGYIARRSYTNIEALMIKARAVRNQKEK